MLRWLLIGFLIYCSASGLRDGWIVVKWNHLWEKVGFTSIDLELDSER